ncbi:hypothetical protein BKA65DRAFT_15743 [Rhexocercosporidium sp. MPI-PUGE-AT-0058]|nr:hypothetical protein BKA65DRAFT_15743 [Rhexocercosporidium sp. MPI-PUGE-AT-0058]
METNSRTIDIQTVTDSKGVGGTELLSSLHQQSQTSSLGSTKALEQSSAAALPMTSAPTIAAPATPSSGGFTSTDAIHRRPVEIVPAISLPPLTTSAPTKTSQLQSTPVFPASSISDSSPTSSSGGSPFDTPSITIIPEAMNPSTPSSKSSITSTSTVIIISNIMETITLVVSLSASRSTSTKQSTTSFTATTVIETGTGIMTRTPKSGCRPNQRCLKIVPELAPTNSLAQTQLSQPKSPNPESLGSVYWIGFSGTSTEETSLTSGTPSPSSSPVNTTPLTITSTSALSTTRTEIIFSTPSSTDSVVSIEIIPSRHRTSDASPTSLDIIPIAGVTTISNAKAEESMIGFHEMRRLGMTWRA